MTDQQEISSDLTATFYKCSLFQCLTAEQLDGISARVQLITAPRGKLIMVHGDQSSDIFFLLAGAVIGQLVAENGREILFTEIAQGGYFGEFAALDEAPRSVSVSATAPCRLARISGPEFLTLLRDYPEVSLNLLRDLTGRLRHMNECIFGLVVHDVETRLRIRLMQLAQEQEQLVQGGVITGLPTHEILAGYIGSNREAVSRAIARLNKAGVIATRRKKAEITDLAGRLAPLDQELA